MALAWLARIQLICAAGVLIWLAVAVGFAARDGFEPARERYTQTYTGIGAVNLIKQLLPPRGRGIVAVLGEAPERGGERAAVEATLSRLSEQGVEVRRCDLAGLPAAVQGAHLLCVVEDRPEHRRLDWPGLREALAQPWIADFTSLLPDGEADAAGLEMIRLTRPVWPAWQDPEFQQFVAHVRAAIPDEEADEARILLVAGQQYRTSATRSRWFLMLNYALAPRRIYMWNPAEASGYVMQYFRWVEQMNRPERWSDARYLRMSDRALSKLDRSTSAPTRGLTAEELAAADALGAQWVLLQTPNVDFRLVDWELVPLERARAWSGAQR